MHRGGFSSTLACAGKVALVTGAAGKGMGRSIALTLAREGASVVVNYRTSAESANAIVAHIVRCGGTAAAVQADIFDSEACERLAETAIDMYGRIDICVVGPGAGWNAEPPSQLEPAAALDDVRRELAPLFFLMPQVLPGMVERGWGRLIGLALHPREASPAYAYNVGKAARTQALLLAERQLWRHGVTVNAIAPGPVAPVESLADAVELCDHGVAWQQRGDVTPQDIAEGVAFLCSEAGRFVTGCLLPYEFSR